MSDDTPLRDNTNEVPPEEADASVPYVRKIAIYSSAEDVKRVQFIGDETTVDVGITDEVMVEFLDVANLVFEWIHSDMAHMRDIMAGRFNDEDDEQKEDDE